MECRFKVVDAFVQLEVVLLEIAARPESDTYAGQRCVADLGIACYVPLYGLVYRNYLLENLEIGIAAVRSKVGVAEVGKDDGVSFWTRGDLAPNIQRFFVQIDDLP